MSFDGCREIYINPYTDFGFKKLFGTDLNKDLLISFINALLEGREHIEDLTYLNTEHLGIREMDRKAVFDVYCENDKGEKILIEMQKGEQQFFKDRSLYYATFPIKDQAEKGRGWNYELKAVYVIGILNFTLDDKHPNYYRREVKLMDTKLKEVFYDKLTFIYLEMPKFNKGEDELKTLFDKWLFVLKNLGRLQERSKALQERIFTKLFAAAEIAKFSQEEYYAYEESLKVYRDWFSVIQTAEKKGMTKGRKEGLEEGRKEGRKEGLEEGLKKGRQEGLLVVARNLKRQHLSAEDIAAATGLSNEEIEAL